MKEEHIFHHALELVPDRRAAYLDEACGPDTALRERVHILLQAHANPGSFLASAAPTAGVELPLNQPALEKPGTQIGPYKLLELIGEGGMGLVFAAEQHQPVRRRVALKVIKPGMDTRDCLARFEAERHALALMDHPHIARVLDAGATAAGRPYFVMELVKGAPITEHCDENRLSPRERLDLFVHVCHAVQHAHQKGIIHRDIKPSNVLVASHDGTPVVKVIDFGVAKAIGQQLTEQTIHTAMTQMVGTPLYMSPEQAGMSSLDIDTRTDIYSLGVLLYELLTGTTPFDKKRLNQAAFDEIRRIIREEEPPKPSTRLSSSESLPSIAANRNTEPARLSRTVRGELDWIVMKALEKDRARRYETASGLAMDVQRYLADEPVQACPPSASYRWRKFARRNRAALVIACAAFTGLLLLVAGLAVSNRLITASRNQTADALHQKGLALEAAKTSAEQAEVQRKRAEQNFRRAVVAVRDLMGSPALGNEGWHQLPADLRKSFEDKASAFYASLLEVNSPDPSLRYEMAVGQASLGTLYQRTDAERGRELLRKSVVVLEELHRQFPSNADYRQQLAWTNYMLRGDIQSEHRMGGKESLLKRSIDLYEGLMSERPGESAYYNEAAIVHQALGRWLLDRQRRFDDAERIFRRAVEIHEQHAARFSGEPASGAPVSWELDNDMLGATTWVIERALPHAYLAQINMRAGRMEEAADLYGRWLKVDPIYDYAWCQSATLYLSIDNVERYRDACRELLDRFEKFGPTDPRLAHRLATACVLAPDSVPDFSRVERLAERAITGTEREIPYRQYSFTKGLTEYRAGRLEQAARWLERSLTWPPTFADTVRWDSSAYAVLAMAHHRLGQPAQARAALACARHILANQPHDWMRNRWCDALQGEILCREAEGLIGTLSPQEIAAERRQVWERELAELSRDVQQHPGSPFALAARAKWLVVHGRFAEAEADYAILVERNPTEYMHWYYRACLLAYLGRTEQYREHCRAMPAQFADSQDTTVLDRVTKSALLLPGGAGGDVQELAGRAERVRQAWPTLNPFIPVLLKGIAEYRAGHCDQAAVWMERVNRQVWPAINVTADSFLALSHHRLGQQEQARALLERAIPLAAATLPTADSGRLDDLDGIDYWLAAQIALREAEETILGRPPGAPPMAAGPAVPPPPQIPSAPTPFRGRPAALPGIVQAEDFDEGGPGLAYHDTTYEDVGAQAAIQRYRIESVDIDDCADTGGGFNIGGIPAGEWLAYTVEVKEAGAYDFDLRLCSPGGGKLHIEIGGQDVTGPVTIPRTGWFNWTTTSVKGVRLEAGQPVMRVEFDAAVADQYYVGNLNWIEARRSASAAAAPSAATGGNPKAPADEPD